MIEVSIIYVSGTGIAVYASDCSHKHVKGARANSEIDRCMGTRVVITMTNEEKMAATEFHKKIAIETNNAIWPILDKKDIEREELDNALQMAYTSKYHWGVIGEPINLARADYMVSRVYSAMKRPELALHHAERCLEITKETGIGDWDLAFAYEAITRAYAIAGNEEKYEKYNKLTKDAIKDIADEKDKAIVEGELNKIIFPP